MQVFECQSCKKAWSFSEIVSSVVEFGFINLISPDDEIIAFNCPDKSCFSLIKAPFKQGDSKNFHFSLTDTLNPSGYSSGSHRFNYLSSLPFSRESAATLQGFGVGEYISSLWAHEEEMVPMFNLPYKDYYYSFNDNCLSAFNDGIRIFGFKKIDIDRLLMLEKKHNYRTFPRYVLNSNLFERIDLFLCNYFINENSLLEFSIMSHNKQVSGNDKNKSNASQVEGRKLDSRGRLEFYDVLSCYYEEITSFNGLDFIIERSRDDEEHLKMVSETRKFFENGALNELLDTLSEEFIHKIKPENFCYHKIWGFKEQYMRRLYQACKAGSLTKQKQRKLRPDQRARLACQAIAKKLWEDNPEITIKEMSKRPELRDACHGAYTDDTRYDYIQPVSPSSKPGRPRKKK